MLEHWHLVVADLRREYQLGSDAEVAALTAPEFWRLLRGLSLKSRFWQTWDHAPKHMHDPADRAALIAAARR